MSDEQKAEPIRDWDRYWALAEERDKYKEIYDALVKHGLSPNEKKIVKEILNAR
jgi:hypothetical protein